MWVAARALCACQGPVGRSLAGARVRHLRVRLRLCSARPARSLFACYSLCVPHLHSSSLAPHVCFHTTHARLTLSHSVGVPPCHCSCGRCSCGAGPPPHVLQPSQCAHCTARARGARAYKPQRVRVNPGATAAKGRQAGREGGGAHKRRRQGSDKWGARALLRHLNVPCQRENSSYSSHASRPSAAPPRSRTCA